MPQGYILGIGTNLDPERNTPRIVEHLLKRFGRIVLSRFYETEPVGMDSRRQFINFCAFIGTALEREACKAACVAIELELGRDRSHPARRTRDRAADIDLLIQVGPDGSHTELQPVSDYLAGPTAEIIATLSPGRAAAAARGRVRPLSLGAMRLGEAPAAINRDHGTGLIVVG